MSNRFNIFSDTELFRDYQFVFENKNITEEDIDFYNNAKSEYAVMFNCSYCPSDDQITSYIRREELEIETKYISEFLLFVKVIFERLTQSLFNYSKQKKVNDKELIKQAKAEERARIKEIKKQEKLENKIREADKICMCECGKTYTYSNKLKHIQTNLHKERLEAIEWYKSNL